MDEDNESFIQKYKWWLILGGVGVVVLLVLYERSQSGTSSSSSTGTPLVTTVPDTSNVTTMQNLAQGQATELGLLNQLVNPSNSTGLTTGNSAGTNGSGVGTTAYSNSSTAFSGTNAITALPTGQTSATGITLGSTNGTTNNTTDDLAETTSSPAVLV